MQSTSRIVFACFVAAIVLANNYLPLPNQLLLHKSCIDTNVASEPIIDGKQKQTCEFAPRSADTPLQFNITNGWIAYAGSLFEKNLTSFVGYFVVPPKPKKHNPLTTLFLFTGIEPTFPHSFEILQPVLQYGISGCGGSEFHWTYGSYYVAGMRAHCSKLVQVQPGDVLLANMTMMADGTWQVISAIVEAKSLQPIKTVTLNAKTISPGLKWGGVTLEVYRLYNCDNYPGGGGSTKFFNLQLESNGERLTPQWNATVKQVTLQCGQNVDITSANEVSLSY